MTRVFESPTNGYRETVGGEAAVLVFLFGAIYLAIKGIWPHVFLWLAIVVLPSIALGPGYTLVAVFVLSIVYATTIQSIIQKKYLSAGWFDVTAATEPEETDGEPIISVGHYRAPTQVVKTEHKSSISTDTKKCPMCAETIKREAIKCRYCTSDLTQ